MSFHAEVTEGFVESAGVRVRYYDNGESKSRLNGRTIVLLHGTGGSSERTFWALYPMLSFKHRVIALDFVDDTGEDTSLTLDHLVNQALSVIKHRVPDHPVTLLGYSLGAVIAAQIAGQCPEAIDNLVLVAGWSKTDAHQELRYRIWQELYESDHPSLASFMAYAAYSPGFLNSKTTDELERLVAALRTGRDRSKAMALNRTIDITDVLPNIRARTLVVGCTFDQMVPLRHSHLLFGGIADASFVEIPSGHGVVHERPAELFRAVHDFVTTPSAFAAGTVGANHHA
ncbi:alpha/beta fold hydrolase [Mycolicibacterium sp. YH-1]|uniref:alpha/beta fold hydrolase n=1 Tax=Mycolicibacterium sp. YH-1 TaxID=2908837 RepID=UPI001F4C3B84|nr:alpha/beta hydrolase [Mycolicibacterium sp. YH-1]UNB53140.1 alpha/beta hydrolase [Mycolicibacterium sp. YH-1]